MNQAKSFVWLALFLFSTAVSAQKKSLTAQTASEHITVNGRLEESAWLEAPIATDFVMYEPDNGKLIDADYKSEVRVIYDNTAIYIGAILRDPNPKKMLKEVTTRDTQGTSEMFGVYINGFNDGQQDYRFYVTLAGIQLDCIATEDGEDYTWDAIWNSEVTATEEGWVVEMRIPYAALRFTQERIQTWGLNFFREIRSRREKYMWNPVDNAVGNTLNQAGILEGLQDLKPPTRLFFIPYASYYYDSYDGTEDHTFKAGMDIKYGISDGFTLDAILIPDFGQTKFDNVIMNLTPFEQQFNENRPFFTESTDLFAKSGLLYSRRIGGSPSYRPRLGENEVMSDYPSNVDLLNAIKLSGRTKKGLGIGVLNAVTKKTTVDILNTATGESVKEVVEPLTNYNMVVLDQRFNQNSSVTFSNSNVMRSGHFRDANATALNWDLNTKQNTYKLTGNFKYSYINDIAENRQGYNTMLNFMKTHGKFRYDVMGTYVSKEYDINDMGYMTINNYYNIYAAASYRILNPTKNLATYRITGYNSAEFENTTGKLQEYYWGALQRFNTRKYDYFEIEAYLHPLITYDFYEPRVDGRYLYKPRMFSFLTYFSSNYNRPFSIDVVPSTRLAFEKDRYNYGLWVSPRYRFNNQFSMILSADYVYSQHELGYVDNDASHIYIGQRRREYLISDITAKYALNKSMSINLVARHYWSYAHYNKLFTLNNDGSVNADLPASMQDVAASEYDMNWNLWNFDLNFVWWFAPASQLSVLYRNNAEDYSYFVEQNLGRNFNNTFKNPMEQIISVSLRYFIDYNDIVQPRAKR